MPFPPIFTTRAPLSDPLVQLAKTCFATNPAIHYLSLSVCLSLSLSLLIMLSVSQFLSLSLSIFFFVPPFLHFSPSSLSLSFPIFPNPPSFYCFLSLFHPYVPCAFFFTVLNICGSVAQTLSCCCLCIRSCIILSKKRVWSYVNQTLAQAVARVSPASRPQAAYHQLCHHTHTHTHRSALRLPVLLSARLSL